MQQKQSMKALIVFGSASDAAIAAPLAAELGKDFDVELVYISAHRELEKLQQKLAEWQGDVIIAGAGLAAALPGVVAAMTLLPVFGVPVAAQFGGLDALCSIAQMPAGVPVITCGAGKADVIVQFLRRYKTISATQKIHFVTANADTMGEIDKAKVIAAEKNIAVTVSALKDADAFNIVLVTDGNDITSDEFCLHVPYLTKEQISKPENYLQIMQWMDKGGLWVGVNNTRNAVYSVLRLWGEQKMLPAILYEGSVKNVRGVQGQSPYIFEFSDRYSIFDWGQMPDVLKDKGKALASMAWFFFDFLGKAENWQNWNVLPSYKDNALLQELKKHGAAHHALGLQGDTLLAVKPVQVIKPTCLTHNGALTWDYSAYRAQPENTLVPLEVIFRFGVPEGSSLLKRANSKAYCDEIGLAAIPKTGDMFEVPVVEFSTKLENGDRYLSYADARTIAGLSDAEFADLKTLTQLVALRLKGCFQDIGVELWDGKFEFAFTTLQNGKRGFMLVDSIGPDELRLIKNNIHLSKEILRGYYSQTAWRAGIETAKETAHKRGEENWKRICTDELKLAPLPMDVAAKEQAEMVYKGIANALSLKFSNCAVFTDAWSLDDVVKGYTAQKNKVA
jgi:phosphoribosylaminoimidazole-succinocarboxamide synthase